MNNVRYFSSLVKEDAHPNLTVIPTFVPIGCPTVGTTSGSRSNVLLPVTTVSKKMLNVSLFYWLLSKNALYEAIKTAIIFWPIDIISQICMNEVGKKKM